MGFIFSKKKPKRLRSSQERNPKNYKSDCEKRLADVKVLREREPGYVPPKAFKAAIDHYEFVIKELEKKK